jgi:TM2 domain-containing membrane protein YozV
MNDATKELWNPGIAAVLSLVLPGAGQLYKRQVGRGIVILFLTGFGYLLFILPGLALHVWQVWDASKGDPKSFPS